MANTNSDITERTIGGRIIQFRSPTDAQKLVLGRLMRFGNQLAAQYAADGEQGSDDEQDPGVITGAVERLSKVLDIIDSMVVNPADRDWLEQSILDANLDIDELMDALAPPSSNANREQKRASAKKAPAKKATKAPAKKAPAKKATKSTSDTDGADTQ